PLTAATVLRLARERLARAGAGQAQRLALLDVVECFERLPPRIAWTEPAGAGTRAAAADACADALARLVAAQPAVREAIDAALGWLNARSASARDALHGLLERQAWRLAYWRVASDEINYRRFFDI